MGNIQRRVYAVVELRDWFTGKAAHEGSCQARGHLQQSMVVKEKGCFVFLWEPGIENAQVTFFSDIYQERTVKLSEIRGNGRYRRGVLWMQPGRQYRYPPGTTYLTGKLNLGEDGFFAVLQPEGQKLRLMKDYEIGEKEISVYGFLPGQVKEFPCIAYREGKPASPVFFLSEGLGKAGVYCLWEPMAMGWGVREVDLHRAHPLQIHSDGSFFVAFPKLSEDVDCHILKDGRLFAKVRLQAGKENHWEGI